MTHRRWAWRKPAPWLRAALRRRRRREDRIIAVMGDVYERDVEPTGSLAERFPCAHGAFTKWRDRG